MKKKAIFPFLLVVLFTNLSAQTAQEFLNQEMIKILQKEKILLTPEQKACEGNCTALNVWKNAKQKTKWLERDAKLQQNLLSEFRLPTFCDNRPVTNNLTFANRSIGLLGSYIIPNNNISALSTKTLPDLPIIKSGNQVSIPNPRNDGSNYALNITSSQLFDLNVIANAEAEFGSYMQTKFNSSATSSNEKTNQISIGAGLFNNKLGEICVSVVNRELQPADFEPVYYIWNEYRKTTIQPGDKVLLSFEGMCYYSKVGVDRKEKINFDQQADASGNFPFLKGSINQKLEWTSEKTLNKQENIYTIVMFAPPVLTPVPTREDIIKCWNNFNVGSIPIQSPNGTRNIPKDKPLTLEVTFGPIPNNEVLRLVKLDEDYTLNLISEDKEFIRQITLINDPARVKPLGNNFYSFPVEIERNDDWLRLHYQANGEIVSTEIKLKLFIDNPIGKDTLLVNYNPFLVETATDPVPTIASYEIQNPAKENSRFKYSSTITISSETYQFSNAPRPPRIIDVFGLPNSVDELLKQDLKAARFNSVGDNKFDFSFTISENSNYFSINNRSYRVGLLLEANDSKGQLFKRNLVVEILGPTDLINKGTVASTVILTENIDLITSLKKDETFPNGSTVDDLLISRTVDNIINYQGVIEWLIQEKIVMVNPDRSYTIDSKYIDIGKLK